MQDANELVGTAFFGLSPLVVEDVADEGEEIRVVARTQDGPVPCPACGEPTDRVHGFHHRTVTDVPADARDGARAPAGLPGTRLPPADVPRAGAQSAETLPAPDEPPYYATRRCGEGVSGPGPARLLEVLAAPASRSTSLRMLLRMPLPARRVPRILGVDDFALRRRRRYATVLIDAETGERIDVLPGRDTDALETWLHENLSVEIVCRDGSGAYGEAVRRALPEAVQVNDRWHIWRNLCEAAP
ncbi:hypothetical protein GCM10010430_28980 [Kitasatospora cystarginea]|uniref:Transposase IS204/IS1001/IS1096/IS1165 DDE domain-containing protein n=1 Tax=Kitasatospora cystarginea TaxID=58350 RepID=A0ABN3DZN5_9ACTN